MLPSSIELLPVPVSAVTSPKSTKVYTCRTVLVPPPPVCAANAFVKKSISIAREVVHSLAHIAGVEQLAPRLLPSLLHVCSDLVRADARLLHLPGGASGIAPQFPAHTAAAATEPSPRPPRRSRRHLQP